jgi:hypothetical protein
MIHAVRMPPDRGISEAGISIKMKCCAFHFEGARTRCAFAALDHRELLELGSEGGCGPIRWAARLLARRGRDRDSRATRFVDRPLQSSTTGTERFAVSRNATRRLSGLCSSTSIASNGSTTRATIPSAMTRWGRVRFERRYRARQAKNQIDGGTEIAAGHLRNRINTRSMASLIRDAGSITC